MQFKDYYDILGVTPGADADLIKTAYRKLARKYHPDVSKEAGAEEKFKAVNEAYEALRDPQKRAAYDQLRARGYRPGDDIQPPPGGFGGYGGAPGDFDFEEIFAGGGAGGGFSDFFESLFGRQRPGGPGARPQPRGDTRAKLAVPLEAYCAPPATPGRSVQKVLWRRYTRAVGLLVPEYLNIVEPGTRPWRSPPLPSGPVLQAALRNR